MGTQRIFLPWRLGEYYLAKFLMYNLFLTQETVGSCLTPGVACDPGRSVSTLGAWTFPNQAEGRSVKLGVR